MSKQISSLSVGLFGNIAPFAGAMRAAIAPVKNLAGSITSAGTSLLKFTGIGAAVSAGFEALKHIGDGFKVAADLEKTQVQFAALIGDSGKAKTAIADLTEFAKATPFEMPSLIDASRELLAFGVSNEKLLPSLKAIGDVAAGVGQPLDEVVKIFGRVAEEGTVTDRTLKEFAKSGIPITQELAKQFNVPKEAIKGLAESGQIGFAHLQQAFANLTGPGGKFADQMQKQAGSLGGLWTRLSGSIEEALGGIAQTLVTAFDIKGGIAALTSGLTAAGTKVSQFIAYIAPILRSVAVAAYEGFIALYNRVSPVIAAISNFVTNAWSRLVPIVTNAGAAILATVTAAWNSVYNFIAPIAGAIYQVIADNWQATLVSITGYALAIWDVVSSVWGVIVELAQTVWSGVTAVWQWGAELITGHTTTAGESIAGTFQGIVSVSNWLRDTVTTVFETLGYVISHWKEGITIVGLEVILAFVRMGNEAQYIFGTVIPAIAVWFGNNWKDIFKDMFNFTTTIMGNLAGNIVSIIKNIPGLISGSVSFSDLWTPLTTGFTSALKELPNIPARQMGELENSLDSEVSALEKKYGEGLGQHLAERAEQAKDVAGKITSTFKDLNTTPKIDKPKIPQPDAPKVIPQLTPDNLVLGITPEIKRPKALRVGSAEAQLARYGVPKLAIQGLNPPPKPPQPARPLPPPAPNAPAWKPEAERGTGATAKDQLSVEKDSNFYIRQLATQAVNIQPAVFS